MVEDDHDFGEVVLEHLKRLGHVVKHANNAPQALSLIDGFAPDVVLVDIRLPIFDGNNIAGAVREHWTPRPRLIALTSMIDLVDTRLFDAWLEKPATVTAVSKALTDSFLRSATMDGAACFDVEDTVP